MSIVTTPTYPVVGEQISLSITGASGDTAATRFELTSLPSRSGLAPGLLVDAGGAYIQSFAGDVQGAYGVRAYDLRRYGGVGAFPGDPTADARDVLLGTQTGTVYVGAIAELPIVTIRGDGATLRLRILNSTVRAAELVDPLTEVSRVCTLEPAVQAAVAAMVGVSATALDLDFATDINNMAIRYQQHIKTTAGVHSTPDGVNDMQREGATSQASALLLLVDMYDHFLGHTQALRAGGTWHLTDDSKNLPITKKPVTLAEAIVCKADLRVRCYSRHLGQTSNPAVHGAADLGNSLSSPTTLPLAIAAYLDALVNATPTAPAGEQEGAVDIARAFGFTVRDAA